MRVPPPPIEWPATPLRLPSTLPNIGLDTVLPSLTTYVRAWRCSVDRWSGRMNPLVVLIVIVTKPCDARRGPQVPMDVWLPRNPGLTAMTPKGPSASLG